VFFPQKKLAPEQSIYGVTAFFQNFGILVYAFISEKTLRLVGRNFGLAIW